ncbi:hypothetical protein QYM36_005177 [Artemia franciscana]|uniref:Uncharacterized protein n=1 Tax=Artemia franciscana TaxID=6661 RepID=A0AA88I213_ARTSF|nr:hypothetical protein QYM36_005177 [Artemia franciscana]
MNKPWHNAPTLFGHAYEAYQSVSNQLDELPELSDFGESEVSVDLENLIDLYHESCYFQIPLLDDSDSMLADPKIDIAKLRQISVSTDDSESSTDLQPPPRSKNNRTHSGKKGKVVRKRSAKKNKRVKQENS